MNKVLLIEDEPALRANVARLLGLEGFDVLTAANGAQGLALATTELPELVICDLLMPELDGYGVLRALRADPNAAATRFIFLTASANQAEREASLREGADAYVTKPFEFRELLAVTRRALAR